MIDPGDGGLVPTAPPPDPRPDGPARPVSAALPVLPGFRRHLPSLRKPLLLAGLCALLVLLWWATPDVPATRQVEAGLKRALTTFAAARALDAVISVAQGTQVALEPGGVGVVLAPGQALDPINDLVEEFSTLMLAASVSFGVQRVLIAIGGHAVVSALVTAAALFWTALHWRGRMPPHALTRLLLVLLLVRFAVPLVVLGSDVAFRVFMADDYAAAQQAIDGSARQIDRAGAPSADQPPAGESHVERLKRWWSDAIDKPDVGKRLDELRRLAAGAADHIVRLIVIFLLQTVVVPIGLLWMLLGSWRLLYRWGR